MGFRLNCSHLPAAGLLIFFAVYIRILCRTTTTTLASRTCHHHHHHVVCTLLVVIGNTFSLCDLCVVRRCGGGQMRMSSQTYSLGCHNRGGAKYVVVVAAPEVNYFRIHIVFIFVYYCILFVSYLYICIYYLFLRIIICENIHREKIFCAVKKIYWAWQIIKSF